ncbi:MAG: metal-sensitive transcriptional regulator [Phycisphaerae bacterium]|jgi:DNA-binding FrmR family transcriptional regulator|nr:metal-sensitive transcriptional regulator [Phycisphaerae bacterium]
MARSKTSTHSARRAARPALNGAACGCNPGAGSVAGQTRDGVGPGAHAVGVDAAIKAANLKHLKRIEGQVRGIAQMIEEDRYCTDIIQQAAAVQESLRSVAKNLLRNHLTHCAAAAMSEDGPKRDDMIEELLELVGRVAR